MNTQSTNLSRISKLFVDRDQTGSAAAFDLRSRFAVNLLCGPDVRHSYTLQLAVLTAANIAQRCFPGAITISVEPDVANAPLLIWPSLNQSLGSALVSLVGPDALTPAFNRPTRHAVVFGDHTAPPGSLRATFDGWIAKVGPAHATEPLPQREYCSLAGVLAGSLAIAELFFAFADINIAAARRTVALSLWRPNADVSTPEALGVPVQFLPRDLWMLGLGHLGNAYLWSLATMPFQNPGEAELYLNDFDKVEGPNLETGLLFTRESEHRYKTRICSGWLEARGFRTRMIERPFDEHFRCRATEPKLAFCGFDSNPPRRDLATAGFTRVIESGLGGTASNFDTIALHALPNSRPPEELWPDVNPDDEARNVAEQQRVARENPGYQFLAEDECGRYELAGKSVAVPFVGAVAATLVIAEALRVLHQGPAYSDLKLSLSAIDTRFVHPIRGYNSQDFVGLGYCDARELGAAATGRVSG
jgi:hypothetical protein